MAFLQSTRFDSLEDLYVQQLEDLYDAERRLTSALPKMAEAAHKPELQQSFRTHEKQTEGHVRRLEEIFRELGREPEREVCKAMKGLIDEGETIIKAEGSDNVRDAGLIAAAQRVEHYEMAGYGTVRNFARNLGYTHAADLLQQTLDEEGETDKLLTRIAEEGVNPSAQHGANI